MVYSRFKIILVGAEGVGKTTYLTRLRTGEFEKKYLATLGVEIQPYSINTNHGKITFDIWDCSGQDMFTNFRENYYLGGDAALIMVDNTSKSSFKCVPDYIKKLREVNPNIHIVLCSNKFDCKLSDNELSDNELSDNELSDNELSDDESDTMFLARFLAKFAKKLNIEHVLQISAKSNYNFEKPFLYFLRKLVNEDCNYDYEKPIDYEKPVVKNYVKK